MSAEFVGMMSQLWNLIYLVSVWVDSMLSNSMEPAKTTTSWPDRQHLYIESTRVCGILVGCSTCAFWSTGANTVIVYRSGKIKVRPCQKRSYYPRMSVVCARTKGRFEKKPGRARQCTFALCPSATKTNSTSIHDFKTQETCTWHK